VRVRFLSKESDLANQHTLGRYVAYPCYWCVQGKSAAHAVVRPSKLSYLRVGDAVFSGTF